MARAKAAANVFHVVADANRRSMLDVLTRGEVPVGAIAEQVGLSYSAASQHLAILLAADLVRRRQEGRQRLYRLNAAPLRDVAQWVSRYETYWTERLDRLEAYFKRRKP